MAYALLAGVDAHYGLYCAIVVTAVAAVFGSSSHLINGPTSAISLVVFGALSFFDPDQKVEAAEGMFLLGAMVGAIQIFIAVFKLGDLARVRNPDAACLEQLEHFLRAADQNGVTVVLAGLRPDLLDALHRLHFLDRFAPECLFPQGKDEDSATLAAIRAGYQQLPSAAPDSRSPPGIPARSAARLYYQV